MMLDYTELHNQYAEFVHNENEDTPDDLRELVQLMQQKFRLIDRSRNPKDQENYLNEINDLIREYNDKAGIYEKVISNTASRIPDYRTLLHGIDDEEKVIPPTEYGISGEYMLEQVHKLSELRRPDNELHMLFVELIGRWIDEYDVVENLRKYNLKNATKEVLDLWGYQYGIYRNEEESDDDYRQRIINKLLELFTIPYVLANGVTFFTCVSDPHTRLTSKNTYLTNDYLCYASNDIEEYFNDNYICWRDIIWL